MIELHQTKDGSNTLFNPDFNEHYHSIFGALEESKHVFIQQGIAHYFSKQPSEINVLEIGFGTGLNAILSLQFSIENNVKVNYYTIEKYPIHLQLALALNFEKYFNENLMSKFKLMHECPFEAQQCFHKFQFVKYNVDILDMPAFDQHFDVVFFDAFSPNKQPQLWTEKVFKEIYNLMAENGILVTYCAKGIVKRTLKQCGFKLEIPPGAAQKREMIRAVKSLE